jgi:hypothetical protein
MVREPQPIDVSTIPELARLADEVERTGRPRVLRRGSRDVAVLVPIRSRLDEGYQSIPALDPPRSWDEVTELAAEEHAQHVAREGLPRRS